VEWWRREEREQERERRRKGKEGGEGDWCHPHDFLHDAPAQL